MRAAMVVCVFWLGCGTDAPADGNRKGGEGTSCLTTNDCKSPFECVANVCVDPNASPTDDVLDAGDVTESDVDDPTDEGGGPPDVEIPDLGPPPSETAAAEVIGDFLGEAVEPADEGRAPELPDGQLNPIGDCESLGISSEWEGVWTGEVSYTTTLTIPGAPSQGTLPVAGDMSYEIQCIDAKLVVLGEMDGMALNEYPFTLELQGGYNPSTGALSAKMINGSVKLFGLIDVLFEGDLIGALSGADMSGTWEGESTGTNPPGIPGSATGNGDWFASPI